MRRAAWAQAAIAVLGTITQRVDVKGQPGAYQPGEVVLLWPAGWAMSTTATIWKVGHGCRTQVARHSVRAVAS